MSDQLPHAIGWEARGDQYKSHYTDEENNNKALDINKLEIEREKRKVKYDQIAHDNYELTTDSYEQGYNKKFHFGAFLDEESSPGMRGLDVGCGIGESARQYAKWADVHVTGISISPLQIDRASYYATLDGTQDKTKFVRGDFCKMPFADNTFDFVYAHEATVHAAELSDVYTEVCRVLKPGAIFGLSEWCMTGQFDSKNSNHCMIRQRIERGTGIVNLRTISQAMNAFRYAGFEVLHSEDRGEKSIPGRPWWCGLDGQTSKFRDREDRRNVWKLKPSVYKAGRIYLSILAKLHIIPTLVLDSLDTQIQHVSGLIDGAREGIFTPMYMIYGKKPDNWVHPNPVKAREAAARVAAVAQELADNEVTIF